MNAKRRFHTVQDATRYIEVDRRVLLSDRDNSEIIGNGYENF